MTGRIEFQMNNLNVSPRLLAMFQFAFREFGFQSKDSIDDNGLRVVYRVTMQRNQMKTLRFLLQVTFGLTNQVGLLVAEKQA